MNDIKIKNIDTQLDRNLKTKQKNKKYSLDELVEKITPENRHQEVDFGLSVGREIF